LPGSSRHRAAALAARFAGTVRISRRLVEAIARGEAQTAERIARELNEYVRAQVVAHFSVDLARQVQLPTPRRRENMNDESGPAKVVRLYAKAKQRSGD